MKEKVALLSIVCLFAQFFLVLIASAENAQPLMLAKQYHENIDVKKYWVSEKLDGIRARWDGHKLVSKNGHPISVPTWFTHNFPDRVMEGELWLGRNQYEETSSITSKKIADQRWSKIKLMLFDMPEAKGTFSERLLVMRRIIKSIDSPYISVIPQFRVNSHNELMSRLQSVVNLGGEGLMLHHEASNYKHGRSEYLLKLKKFDDAEATVIGYKPGKGQFENMLGSIKVRNDQGKEFYIGSGFNKRQRQHPPALLSRVTYQYQGFTNNGLPRFPVFLRIRDAE